MSKQITVTIDKTGIIIIAVVLALGVSAAKLASETLTLTTYYPAPYGAYKKIVTTDATVLARDAGRVGVGTADPQTKLDVNGLIKTGTDSSTPCTASLKGAQRYNDSAGVKAMEYCDGTIWQRIDSATAWIAVHPGGVMKLFNAAYTDDITWLEYSDGLDHTPTKMCKDAGYSNYAGPCQAQSSRFAIEGSTVYNREGGVTRISCLYGKYTFTPAESTYNTGQYADSAAKILCVK